MTSLFEHRSGGGAPGERGARYYFSYFRALDGNKPCALAMG